MIWTCLSLVISLSFTLSSLFLHKLIGNFELKCSLGTLSIRFPFFPLTGDHRQWYCCSQAPFQHGSPPQWACDTGPSLWQRGPKWCLSWPFLVEFRSPQGTLGMFIGCHRKCREVCRWKDAKTPAKTQNKSFFFHKLRRSMHKMQKTCAVRCALKLLQSRTTKIRNEGSIILPIEFSISDHVIVGICTRIIQAPFSKGGNNTMIAWSYSQLIPIPPLCFPNGSVPDAIRMSNGIAALHWASMFPRLISLANCWWKGSCTTLYMAPLQ